MKDEKGGPMKELDFDELHEAVNKLMDQAQKPKAKREPVKSVAKAVSRPSVKVAERSAEKDPQETKEKPKPKEDTGSPISVTVHRPATKIAPKKRGMAMDVVQTTKPAAVAPPSARTARTAPTLQPTGPVKAEAPSPRVASPATVAEPSQPAISAHDVSDDTLASLNMQADGDAKPKTILDDHKPEFPDPLEVHGFSDGEEPARPHAEPEAPVTPLSGQTMAHGATTMIPPAGKSDYEDPLLKEDDGPAKNQWEMPEPDAPQEVPATEKPEATSPSTPAPEPTATPFVNAKVEKRPLGAYATTPALASPVPAPAHDEPKLVAASEEKTEPANASVPAAPEELNPEVVAVESADIDYSQAQGAEHDAPLNNLRQMAIPQQYHAGDKKTSKQDRPIFDTKDYHPPIQPVATAKHHTGSKAGTILTLILIILLVAAGVGAYFVATGSIDITRLF